MRMRGGGTTEGMKGGTLVHVIVMKGKVAPLPILYYFSSADSLNPV